MKTKSALSLLLGLLGSTTILLAEPPPNLTEVPFTSVKVEDAFWAPRIKLNREQIVPHDLEYCRTTGRIDNFAKAGGLMEGKFRGIFFDDSDVYKVIEGAAYTLAQQRDPALERKIDDIIDKIAAAQQSDGYLYSFYTVNKELDKRWSNEKTMHETYCAGHMIEGAIAYYQATGKRKFLDVAIRFADHIDSVFGPNKKHEVPGHEEIELALMKLWRVTNNDRYLKLAEFFVAERGRNCGRAIHGDYDQDHLPISQQREITGHAVRAMYLYSGVADIAAATGNQEYITTMDHIWQDVVQRKMYLTGGIGPSAANEGFTVAYDLPNDSAYAETCASIGMALWNQRMALLHADGKYADVVERVLYNGALSGVALDGKKFFYVNPLASRGSHHRKEWYDCACCPVNVVRFLPIIGGYAYAHDGTNIFVNQYVSGQAGIQLTPSNWTVLKQETKYPWDGAIRFEIEPRKKSQFALNLRVPGWCQGTQSPDDLYQFVGKPESNAISVKINGTPQKQLDLRNGYVRLERKWNKGDVVELNLPMVIRRVKANSKVQADAGRVALQRGPIVYCLEGIDNDGCPRSFSLPKNSKMTPKFRPDLLGGVTVIEGDALLCMRGAEPKPVRFTAVPYYSWDNRDAGQMVVWLPEEPSQAEIRPQPTVAALSQLSASHKNGPDVLEALNDQVDAKNSNDHSIPRFTWWDHRGGTEWVQYTFKAPANARGVEVYWFDDKESGGGCRVPKSARLLYSDGQTWKPVPLKCEVGVEPNQFNRIEFDPFRLATSALRLEVELQAGFSGGILEWRVLE